MGVTLICTFYPKECIHEKVLPYLNQYIETDGGSPLYCEVNGNHMSKAFYDKLNSVSHYFKSVDAHAIENVNDLFEFSRDAAPAGLTNYIVDNYRDGLVLVVWVR